jgi:hypothetical protein
VAGGLPAIPGLGVKAGNRPPDVSPPGSGRRGAFREAKRQNDIPVSKQPDSTGPNKDKDGNVQPGRQYTFKKKDEKDVIIRDDAAGHNYGPNDPQNRGPHFNDGKKNHFDYKK